MKVKIETEQTVVEIDQGVNPTTGEAMGSRWSMTPDQAVKHLPQFESGVGIDAQKIAPGDASAIRDAANELAKQLES